MESLKLWTRIKRTVFPTWEVRKAEPDYYVPTKEIRVRVAKPLGKDSRIKIKGNAMLSDWHRMAMPFYWVGKNKCRIFAVNKDMCRHLVHLKARVRVPALEEQHRDEIRKLQKKEYSNKKHGR